MRPGDGRAVPNFFVQALDNRPMTIHGDGSQTRSLCHVDDLVAGILALASSDESGPVNLGNPEEITILELAQRIRSLCGSSSEIVHQSLMVDDPRRRQPDITRATTALGWQPKTSLELGLKRTLPWFASLHAC